MVEMADPVTPIHNETLLRNHGGGHAPVTYLELFFDLVYVFAITQLSHFIINHLGWAGFAEAILLFLAVWWVWMYTTWAANWADPEKLPVRLLLLAMMLLSMIMAAAIPYAFGKTGLLFAGCYVTMQVGRSLFMARAMRRGDPAGSRSMVRIACWFAVSGVAWIYGALQSELPTRMGLWALALLIEYAGPACGYRTPRLGRSKVGDWNISGSHMAERCALFIIIALGEGVIVTGAAFASQDMTSGRISAFLLAFLSSILMWWLYFDLGAARGARHIESHDEPGRIARSAYTYLHMPIVAGIVIAAAADALVLSEPFATVSSGLILVQSGGLLTYLAGTGAFKRFSSPLGNFPLSHLVGVLLLLVAGAWGWSERPPALAFVAVSSAVLLVVAVWEWGSFHGGWKEKLRPPATG